MSGLSRLYDRIERQPRLIPLAIVAVSAGSLLAALFFQFVVGLAPCPLCHYQRYVHLGILVIGLLGFAFTTDRYYGALIAMAGTLGFLASAGVAGFHVGVEQQWWEGLAACQGEPMEQGMTIEDLEAYIASGERPVACDEVPWSLAGISMAGYNFLISLGSATALIWISFALRIRIMTSPKTEHHPT